MSVAHPFDAAVALLPCGGDEFEGATHPGYANMVGPFGGITAGTLLNAACLHPQRLGEPLALTVNYAGPIADGAFRIQARPVRTNRATQHWQIELRQGDVVCTTASAVFGLRRSTWAATEVHRPQVPAFHQIEASRPNLPMTWMQRYEMRFITGPCPPTAQEPGSPASRTVLWIRDAPPRRLDALSLAAICDNFYPRVFLRRGRFGPAGTVSITVYFHADALALAEQGERPVLAQSVGQHFGGGYFDQTAQVWGESGGLLASSHQLVYFKD